MNFNGPLTHAQFKAHDFVGFTFDQQSDHVTLARRQPIITLLSNRGFRGDTTAWLASSSALETVSRSSIGLIGLSK